ncbi:helix-turn-helix transcriptional regulator [Kitasatospora sp. NA04385]|uniref:helix-turn-helix domain-containing protein n=1 Tax=Kitasatospora sp. NA04385 TaxID=2742135 RepID=UPI001592411F|nr:helix-turn-helix transcriptional regulator [Kitasatospora sp. NA04385]QKW20730.1 helix-turn-helix transcriptional regulator [Kitasatospora sp. NA04385]
METRRGTDPRETFGCALRAHRRDARLTQRELAAKAGLGVRTLSDLERGVAGPRPATAALLSAALGLGVPASADFHALARDSWHSARA